MKSHPFILSLSCVAALGVFASGTAQAATVYVNETFESYADTAALSANWSAPTGLSLNSGGGHPGNAGQHDGSASAHIWTGPAFSVTPTDEAPLVLSADIWYSGAAAQRNTVGLRNGANPLFEMGFYNDAAANGLGVRVLSFAGSPNWVGLVPYTTLGTGEDAAQWIRLEATFTSTQATITYDLGADGTVDGTYNAPGGAFSANPFIDLRFGGPSGLSSAGGGFLVDNIYLRSVPEPASLAFLALGAAGLIRRRR